MNYLILILLLIILFCSCQNSIEPFQNNQIGDIYFIVSPNSERIDNVNNQIKKSDLLDVKIFNAIMGKDLTDRQKQDYIKKKYINKDSLDILNPGQIGVALSHLTIIEEFINSNKPYITIFEDDVILPDNFKQLYTEYINELPEDYDIAYLYLSKLARYCAKRPEMRISKKNIVVKGYPQYGTVGYRLSRKGAIKLYELLRPCDWSIDNLILFHIREKKLNSYCPRESIVDHKEYDSIIQYDSTKKLKFHHLHKYLTKEQQINNKNYKLWDIKSIFHRDLKKCK